MKVIVIKCGGSILNSLSEDFFLSIDRLKNSGFHPVLVHGGGPDINETLDLYKIKPEFKDGLRKTTEEVMHIVELVLSGKTNRKLVNLLEHAGHKALGLNGSDCSLLQAAFVNWETLGFVGKVESVNKNLLESILEIGCIPVITPIASGPHGQKLNVNADMAAGAVASALHAEMCVFVTDVDGVLKDGNLIQELTVQEAIKLIEEGTVYGGMKPKVETALSVLSQGAKRVMIASGKNKFYDNNSFIGTAFVSENLYMKGAAK
ncbi:acetylglutamate kinase [Peribacillus deserti]|uniref:Acetylglutamate kinase n=1 Tax=Peribacillus deserti TaxID=673318 RepID=A0ABS2QLU0_9BACI|nr:acetylglutamate kinase [Peribacillus deserti]MBM7693975.1 acetylglutamate kinase [Peribacillus deserti]